MAADVKKMMGEYISAWNSHDVNQILSFFTDDGVLEDLALGVVSHGKKELTAFLNSSFTDIPDMKFKIKSDIGAGDWSGMEWVMSGTFVHSSLPGMPATGKVFSVRGASIARFRGDKISHETDYYNLVTLLQHVGLMPGQPK